jgi:glyoxylase I family protein
MRTHLTRHGITIETEATHGGARGMGHSFYIRDPFGNLLELKGPAQYPDGRA